MFHDSVDDLFANRTRIGPESDSRLYWILGAACVLISVALFLVNTRHGIGILVDSTRYMSINERPYDAPLYPWILQAGAALGLTKTSVAQYFGLASVVANTFLVWHLLMRSTKRYAYALAGTLIVILAPQFVALHSVAMSEPTFLLCILLTLLAFLRFLETDSRAWLAACAIALGFATLARFTAPPLGAAIAIAILLNPRHDIGRRVADAAIFTIVSASIFFVWVLASQLTAGHSIGRALWFYGNMGAKEWLTSLEALTAWLLPDQVPFALRVAVLAMFVASTLVLCVLQVRATLRQSRETRQVEAMLPLVLGLFFLFYMAFMVLSTSLEANLSLNSRYAFPAYATTVMLVTILAAFFADAPGSIRLLHHFLVGLAAVVLVSHATRTIIRSAEAYRSGIGYASLAWHASPTMDAVRQLPQDALLVSNGADAIAYILGRPASFVPERVQLRTGVENPEKPLELQLQQLRERLGRGPSYVVVFDKVDWRFYLLEEAELTRRLSLVKVADFADGRIYALPDGAKTK